MRAQIVDCDDLSDSGLSIVTGWIVLVLVLDGEYLRGTDHGGHVSFRIVERVGLWAARRRP